jgi:hypothetical protein
MVTKHARSDHGGLVLVDEDGYLFGTADNPLSTYKDAVPVTSTLGGAVNAVLFDVDTTGFDALVVQGLGTWAGGVTLQGMNPGGPWVSLVGESIISIGGDGATVTGPTDAKVFPCNLTRIRAIVTTFTSGSVAVSATLRNMTIKNRSVVIQNSILGVVAAVNSNAPGSTLLGIASLATTNLTVIKATAGNIYDMVLSNNSAANRWFKLYDKTTAPAPATDVPKAKILLKPGETITINSSGTLRFNSGIAFAITAGVANTDTTACAVDDVTGAIVYA